MPVGFRPLAANPLASDGIAAAAAGATTPTEFGAFTQWQRGRVLTRKIGLTAAVLATTYPVWPPQVAVAQVQTPTALAYALPWSTPPSHLVKPVCVDNLGDYSWNPREVAAETATIGFHNQHHVYSPARRSVLLLDGWEWPVFAFAPPPGTAVTTEMWHWDWDTPPNAPAPRLVGQVSWPGLGFSFTQVQTAAELEWWNAFQGPPPAPARGPGTLGDASIWSPQVANPEFQDGWRSAFSLPQLLTDKPRLAGNIAWPGIGYSFLQAATPSLLFEGQWQPQPVPKGRSPALLEAYSSDWIFHQGTGSIFAPVKSSIMFILDNTINVAVQDVNFTLIVSSSTINPDLDP